MFTIIYTKASIASKEVNINKNSKFLDLWGVSEEIRKIRLEDLSYQTTLTEKSSTKCIIRRHSKKYEDNFLVPILSFKKRKNTII